jgi:hypothetical protein
MPALCQRTSAAACPTCREPALPFAFRQPYRRAVTLVRGLAVSLAAFVAAWGVAAGCGSDGADVMRATLTDKGCTYEGDTTPSPGLFTVQVRNETQHVANFSLWELADGSKVAEIEPSYAQALRTWKQTGKASLNPPQLKRTVSVTTVGPGTAGRPGAASELPANESTGRYVVVCAVHAGRASDTGAVELWPPSHMYGAVELDVHSD